MLNRFEKLYRLELCNKTSSLMRISFNEELLWETILMSDHHSFLSHKLYFLSIILISLLYDLVPKGAHARGYALQLKIKHCWKLFLFKMLCCVLAWMNEYIVQIISATRLWLISRYSHHTLKKRWKMTAKNRHPCTEWFSSLYLQTNRKHMENQSLICTRKTSFYTDNITSTLTIVVFSINWSQMFALYVRQMCCKLKTLNKRKTTALLWNRRKRRVCSDPCICSTQRYSFFSSDVLRQIWRIFPRSFDIVVISDVPTR